MRILEWLLGPDVQKLRKKGDVDRLIKLLSHSHKVVRREAAEALGEIGGPRATAALVTSLGDQAEHVREGARRALVKRGDSCVQDALIMALRQGDDRGRERAPRILGAIGGPRVVAALAEALDDEVAVVRIAVVEALSKSGDPGAIEPLTGAIHDQSKGVRKRAAEALGEIGGRQALEALAAGMKHPSESTRCSVAEALGRIAGQEALELLIDALDDTSGTVKSTAAKALGEIGDPRAVEPLLKAMEKDCGSAAADALKRIGDPTALDSVRRWEEDERAKRLADRRESTLGLASQIAGGWPEELDRDRLLTGNFEGLVSRLRRYQTMPHPGSPRGLRPEYRDVSGRVARVGNPLEDFRITTTARMLVGKDRITAADDAASQYAFEVIQEYGSWRLAKTLFHIPRAFDLVSDPSAGPGVIVVEDFMIDCLSAMENVLFEIHEELPEGGTFDDAMVRERLLSIAYS